MHALHVHGAGSRPPVVLLPPGPGLDGSVFWPGAQALAEAPERYWPALIEWLRRTDTGT